MKKEKQINIRFDEVRIIDIDNYAEERGLSRSAFVEFCVDKFLSTAQDDPKKKHELDKLAEAITESYKVIMSHISETNAETKEKIDALGVAMRNFRDALLYLNPSHEEQLNKIFKRGK